MKQLKALWKDIMETGEDRPDRTGTGTRGIFGYQMRFDLSKGFPLSTLRPTPFSVILEELRWFISGSTNINDLNSSIWNEWALEEDVTNILPCSIPELVGNIHEKLVENGETIKDINERLDSVYKDRMYKDAVYALADELDVPKIKLNYIHRKGDLGPIYGRQWRGWKDQSGRYVDQLRNVVNEIKSNPHSRRLIVSAWNAGVLPDSTLTPQQNVLQGRQALAPCHTMFQFYVSNLGKDNRRPKLNCQLYQRSGDSLVGVPFNVASYALLTHLVAKECDMDVGTFVHTLGDAHIYNDETHKQCYETVMAREPLKLPQLIIDEDASLFDFDGKVRIEGYTSHPKLPFKMNVMV